MHATSSHILSVRLHRILRRLHEKHHHSTPELIRSQRNQSHKEENTIKNRDWDELEHIEGKDGCQAEKMDAKMSESRLLDGKDGTIGRLIGHCVDVIERSDRCSYEPRESK
mmetsp:Transcript_15029/g.31874  ORF Transcript_15029/g.31874 Transcript_15029/m.31874 type:complete len:111 (-) Transcript_15029:655-987(-)